MTKASYSIQYQPLRKGALRPEDWGNCHTHRVTDAGLIPSVGDYINLCPLNAPEGYLNFYGRVKSRLFVQYTRFDKPEDDVPAEITVGVNIVVEETDDDWGKLIKE